MPLVAARSAFLPTLLLLLLLYFALNNNINRTMLATWCALIALSKLLALLHSRRWLASGFGYASGAKLLREMALIYGLEGAGWGALPWIVVDSCTPLGVLFALTTIAGVSVSRMTQLMPQVYVFRVAVITGCVIWLPKFMLTENSTYYAFGGLGLLYVIALIIHARNMARSLSMTIELRFENQDLIRRLRAETEAAEAARRGAERANRAKAKFLAAASHDLRQPAHAQGLFLDVLARTRLDEQQQELLANARALAGASTEMLHALLDFSRIEAGVIDPRPHAFAVQPLLNKIEREFGPQADAKGLFYRTHDTDLVACSDPGLVELIVRNLVSNAIRYTAKGGVLVACRRRNGQARFEVWDTGIGIAPEHQASVFHEFLQLGNPERDRRKGLGLGLAIAEGLSGRLGHALTLASRPGRGSVFRLTLPLTTERPATETATPRIGASLRGLHVLFIDDDEAVRAGMSHLLATWGCRCTAVESIDEALSATAREAPDVALCDYRLRGLQTGADAVGALRARLGESLPALLITGDTAPERLAEAHALGLPLLHKPVPPEELKRQLVAIVP